MKKPSHLPRRLFFSIGGYFGTSHRIEWRHTHLAYQATNPWEQFESSAELQPSTEQWAQFWAEVEQARVWSWRCQYHSAVCDGTCWSLELAHAGKRIKSVGLNGYPGSRGPDYRPGTPFDVLLKALKRLAGRDWDEPKPE